jgi:hypothetical protein
MTDWTPIKDFPKFGRVIVSVSGEQDHSSMVWRRQGWGVARVLGDDFEPADIRTIEAASDMARHSGVVTHWMPCPIPPPEPY